MKQLLFLLLFPCLALGQYQGNEGQKITLGEQTTADGLVYRGLAADTTRKPSVDTMAYILLDTNTNIIWQYKKATNNAWTRVGGSISSGLTGVLPVANGGTGSPTQNFVDLTTTQSVGGAKTFTNAVTAGVASATSPQLIVLGGSQGTNMFELRRTSGATATYAFSIAGSYLNFKDVTNNTTLLTLGYVSPNPDIVLGLDETSGSGNNGTTSILRASNSGTLTDLGGGALILRTGRGTGAGTLSDIYFNTADILSSGTSRQPTTTKMTIKGNGNVGIGTTTPAVQFHTTGAVRFATFAGGGTTTLSVDNTGNLARTSSIELKKDVTPINYGLNEILQIKPINFNWIDEDKFGNENENGFIAEDVMSIIPNVVAADTHGLFMDYTKLIPILTKAIQEQQALIKALEQRILTLENK